MHSRISGAMLGEIFASPSAKSVTANQNTDDPMNDSPSVCFASRSIPKVISAVGTGVVLGAFAAIQQINGIDVLTPSISGIIIGMTGTVIGMGYGAALNIYTNAHSFYPAFITGLLTGETCSLASSVMETVLIPKDIDIVDTISFVGSSIATPVAAITSAMLGTSFYTLFSRHGKRSEQEVLTEESALTQGR